MWRNLVRWRPREQLSVWVDSTDLDGPRLCCSKKGLPMILEIFAQHPPSLSTQKVNVRQVGPLRTSSYQTIMEGGGGAALGAGLQKSPGSICPANPYEWLPVREKVGQRGGRRQRQGGMWGKCREVITFGQRQLWISPQLQTSMCVVMQVWHWLLAMVTGHSNVHVQR